MTPRAVRDTNIRHSVANATIHAGDTADMGRSLIQKSRSPIGVYQMLAGHPVRFHYRWLLPRYHIPRPRYSVVGVAQAAGLSRHVGAGTCLEHVELKLQADPCTDPFFQ